MKKLDKNTEKILEELFKTKKKLSPSEWAEEFRYMSSDVSTFTGKFSFKHTPYSREIVDCFSPYSPVRELCVMKGGQLGISTAIECAIGFLISEDPGNILYLMADLDLGQRAFNQKIDNLIDNSGLRHLIRPNSVSSRRTGSTSNAKEFQGGKLQVGAVGGASKLRQESYRYLLLDDVDSAKRDDSTEGNIRDLALQRANSFADKMKVAYISTPTVKATSFIEPMYENGDKRRFHIPCPCCSEYIPWEWNIKNEKDENCGIIYDVDENNNYIENSARYKCQKCGGEFTDKKKAKMLLQGEWIPTAKSKVPNFRSYHLSALYSPPSFFSWNHYARQWCDIQKNNDQGKLKAFLNVVLGQTWEERGKAPQANKISHNTRNYEINTIPSSLSEQDGNGKIILLTCACDLNGLCAGVNAEYCDARLDYEIIAHSESGATYSIDQGSIGTFQRRKSIEGRELFSYKNNLPNNVWDKFTDVISRKFVCDDGREMGITITGVDTGAFTRYAYKYMDTCPYFVVGMKGELETQVMRLSEDTLGFKKSKERNDLFLVKTNKLKNELAEFMKLDWDKGVMQPPNFMNFPIPSANKYTMKGFFCEFEGEQKVVDLDKSGNSISYKWVKKSSSSRNHFWDCRVYNMALRDILISTALAEVGIKHPTWSQFCKLMLNK